MLEEGISMRGMRRSTSCRDKDPVNFRKGEKELFSYQGGEEKTISAEKKNHTNKEKGRREGCYIFHP